MVDYEKLVDNKVEENSERAAAAADDDDAPADGARWGGRKIMMYTAGLVANYKENDQAPSIRTCPRKHSTSGHCGHLSASTRASGPPKKLLCQPPTIYLGFRETSL